MQRARGRRWRFGWRVIAPPLLGAIALAVVFGGSLPRTLANEVTPPASALPGPRIVAAPQVIERRFWSAALGREMPYVVYLPAGYESASRRYPVLYMLHGLGGDHTEWARSTLLATATDLIQRREIPPMVIVMPEGERGYWVDHADGGPRYGTYVSTDLVSYIDQHYRTIPSRRQRAIGGLSMGAHGAIDIGLRHPEEFGVVGAHSLALRKQADALQFFGTPANWSAHDPITLCEGRAEAIRDARQRIWLDIGSGDQWAPANAAFDQQLTQAGIPHVWHEWDGGHNAAYWDAHAADYLRFYGTAFHEESGPQLFE